MDGHGRFLEAAGMLSMNWVGYLAGEFDYKAHQHEIFLVSNTVSKYLRENSYL